MKKKLIVLLLLLIPALFFGKEKASLTIYGSHESIMDLSHSLSYYYDNDPFNSQFQWGWNNLSTLKVKAKVGPYLEFNSSFNITLLAGLYTQTYQLYYLTMAQNFSSISLDPYRSTGLFSFPFYYKSTYIGSFDIDRLYFKVKHNVFQLEAGLIRIARGFGTLFSPTDLFNQKNPINPNARKEGQLAIMSKFYPFEFWRIELFTIAPENPIDSSGWGWKLGHANNFYLGKVNFEFLYALYFPEVAYDQTLSELNLPETVNNDFTHIFGFSLKADVEVGLFIDMVYRLEQRNFKTWFYYSRDFYGYEGLEAAIGIDYTIKGKVYLLLEYMFYGSGVLSHDERELGRIYENDALKTDTEWVHLNHQERKKYINPKIKPLFYLHHHYLYAMLRYKINDIVSLGNTYLFSIEDQSSILTFFVKLSPVQGLTIDITALYPLDWRMLNDSWLAGEFGSTHLGFIQKYRIGCKIKF